MARSCAVGAYFQANKYLSLALIITLLKCNSYKKCNQMCYVADQIVPLDLLLPKQGEDQYKC